MNAGLRACARARTGVLERQAGDRRGGERLEPDGRHGDVRRVDVRRRRPACSARRRRRRRGRPARRVPRPASGSWPAPYSERYLCCAHADPRRRPVGIRGSAERRGRRARRAAGGRGARPLRRRGVCHSDLHCIDGGGRTLPIVLGHEGAGIVEAVGPGVLGPAGDTVVLSWVTRAATAARASPARGPERDGASTACPTAAPACGARGRTRPVPGSAGFAEPAVVPATRRSRSPSAPLEVAALIGCSVMTGVGAVFTTGAGGRERPSCSAAAASAGDRRARRRRRAPDRRGRREEAKLELARASAQPTPCAGRGRAAGVKATRGGVDYAFEAIGRARRSRPPMRRWRPAAAQ